MTFSTSPCLALQPDLCKSTEYANMHTQKLYEKCMQLRDEVILNVLSSNLVNDVFALLAIRHALNDSWALRSLSSILEPPQTLKRHAKRTSWNKNGSKCGHIHACSMRDTWMHEKKLYKKPQILVQYHGAMFAFGQGGHHTPPLPEVYAWEVEGRGQDFHLKVAQISIVLKFSY